jgi:hypothetical protein
VLFDQNAAIPNMRFCLTGRAISPTVDANSVSLFNKCRSWIRECKESHVVCSEYQKSINISKWPNRLLDLGEKGDIRLVEGKDCDGPYATLSHCWGMEQPLTTTKSSIQVRQAGITLTELPPTFQHAVAICRNLSIYYLWIDSLCIIQDDTQDWEIESGKMGSIYQNSYITIAAAGSNDSQGGCFLPRNVPKSAIIPKTFMKIGPLSASVEIPSNSGRELGDIDESPLQKRGWTFQERKLSPRIIHWDKDQIFWECQEYRKAESGMETKNTKNFGKTLQLLERGINGIYNVLYSPRSSQAQRYIQEDIRDDDNEKGKKSSMAFRSVEQNPLLDSYGGMSHPGRGLQNFLQEAMNLFGIELPIESSRFEDPDTGHEKDLSTFEVHDIIGEAADMVFMMAKESFGRKSLKHLQVCLKAMNMEETSRDMEPHLWPQSTNIEPQLHTVVDFRRSGCKGPDLSVTSTNVSKSDDEDFWTHLWYSACFTRYFFWYDLVSEYTRRRLTFGKDKLPALAGTATLVQAVTEDEYIAGHWRKELERSLFWIADVRDRVLPSRPPLQRAPSWAWSSIDGHVTWDFPDLLGNEDSAVDFEIISVNPQGAEVNGPTYHENAWLELIGESLPAKWSGGCWRIASTIDSTDKPWEFRRPKPHYRNVLKDLRILDSSETVIGSWTHDHKLNALLPASGEIEGLTETKLEQLTSWYSENTSTLISLTAAYLGKRTLEAENWKPDDKALRAVALPEELLFFRGATRMVSTDDPDDPRCYEHDILVLTPAQTTVGGFIRLGVGTIRKDYWSIVAPRREKFRIY